MKFTYRACAEVELLGIAPGYSPPAMTAGNTFTMSEIIAVLEDLDIEIEIDPDDDGSRNLSCRSGLLEWTVIFREEGPAYTDMCVFHMRTVESNPTMFVNSFNLKHYSTCAVIGEDDGQFVLEDGEFIIYLRQVVDFYGSADPEILRYRIFCWMDALTDFLEISEEGDNDDATGGDLIEFDVEYWEALISGEARPLEVVISELLAQKGSLTARQISRSIEKDRHAVNRTLYTNSSLFKKDSSQPPRWTLVAPT